MANKPLHSLTFPGMPDKYVVPDITSIAPAYSTSSTYVVGDLVSYDNKIWKCTTAIAQAEAWTAGHWTQTNMAESAATDKTLTLPDKAADAKVVGDQIAGLKEDINATFGNIKDALLDLLSCVVYTNPQSPDLLDALEEAFGESVRVYEWDGVNANIDGWVDADGIIGITRASQLQLVSGHSIKAGSIYISENNYSYDSSGAAPYEITGRATSRSQIITGNFDGKTVGLSSYTLSSGATISFSLWYGYFNTNDTTFNSLQAMSTTKYYNTNYWFSQDTTLPTDASKTGGRFLLMAFKKGDGTTDFTAAELAEIPSLITIS